MGNVMLATTHSQIVQLIYMISFLIELSKLHNSSHCLVAV